MFSSEYQAPPTSTMDTDLSYSINYSTGKSKGSSSQEFSSTAGYAMPALQSQPAYHQLSRASSWPDKGTYYHAITPDYVTVTPRAAVARFPIPHPPHSPSGKLVLRSNQTRAAILAQTKPADTLYAPQPATMVSAQHLATPHAGPLPSDEAAQRAFMKLLPQDIIQMFDKINMINAEIRSGNSSPTSTTSTSSPPVQIAQQQHLAHTTYHDHHIGQYDCVLSDADRAMAPTSALGMATHALGRKDQLQHQLLLLRRELELEQARELQARYAASYGLPPAGVVDDGGVFLTPDVNIVPAFDAAYWPAAAGGHVAEITAYHGQGKSWVLAEPPGSYTAAPDNYSYSYSGAPNMEGCSCNSSHPTFTYHQAVPTTPIDFQDQPIWPEPLPTPTDCTVIIQAASRPTNLKHSQPKQPVRSKPVPVPAAVPAAELPKEVGVNPKHADGPPGNKLFVGNIDSRVTETQLHLLFQKFGTVTNVKVIYNARKMTRPREQWRSREYGFVDFATQRQAAAAVRALHAAQVPGITKAGKEGMIVQYAANASHAA